MGVLEAEYVPRSVGEKRASLAKQTFTASHTSD